MCYLTDFAVAIRLEGGSADDLAVLDEKKNEAEGGKDAETKVDPEVQGKACQFLKLVILVRFFQSRFFYF